MLVGSFESLKWKTPLEAQNHCVFILLGLVYFSEKPFKRKPVFNELKELEQSWEEQCKWSLI